MKVFTQRLTTLLLLLLSTGIFSQTTYTTVQDGNWNSPSTWDANGIAPRNMNNIAVNINHNVFVNNVSINVRNNATFNINAGAELDVTSMDIIIERPTGVVNINSGIIDIGSGTFILDDGILNITTGILIIDNGNLRNNDGVINLNYGRITTCSAFIADYTNSSGKGTFGIGTIYSTNGTIEDVYTGNFSTDIAWCTDFLVNGINLPTPQNCAVANAFPIGDCLSPEVEVFTCRLLSATDTTDTDGDGILDVCDIDDDNDGVSDEDENLLNIPTTNPNTFLELYYTASWIQSYQQGIMIRLTSNGLFQAGSAMSREKISLNDDFTFEYDIKLGDNDAGADGMAFILHNDPLAQAALGTFGAGLGAHGIVDGIALEFDVYNNNGGEPLDDHMTIWDTDTGVITSGDWGQHPDIISTAGHLSIPNIEDDIWHTVTVEYKAATSTIEYILDGTYMLQSVAGIKNTYLDGQNFAYFGWAGATGSFSNDQRIIIKDIQGVTTIAPDTDTDGIANYLDIDSDNDGIPDAIEAGATLDQLIDCRLPMDTSETNGVTIQPVPLASIPNSDSDVFLNLYDIDSDNDGIPDAIEAQPTATYLAPSATVNTAIGSQIGLWTNYTCASLEDTDDDGIYDYLDTDSDNDGIPDIEENGDSQNQVFPLDSDNDGLDDFFDDWAANWDSNDEVSTGTIAELASIFGDADGDLPLGGDLDYRDVFSVNPPSSASIDFDGIDDYVATRTEIISGLTDMTMMGWIKVDPSFTGGVQSVMMGQDNLEINIDNFGDINVEVRFGGAPINAAQYETGFVPLVRLGEWAHIALVYNGSASSSILYINGVERSRNSVVSPSLNVNNDRFTIGRRANANTSHFRGEIDEVKVFNTNLSEEQIQQTIYQEIEQNGLNLRGVVLPKDIIDTKTGATIPWNNLLAYYPMTDILTGKTTDMSGNGRDAILYNITTVQAQTAPMPYETANNGAWTAEGTWLHGDVWDIEDVQNNRDWSIVSINDNVTTTTSHTQLGMFIDADKTLTVTGNNSITNSLYLELNGTLDLAGDSQLIQGENSDLVTSATGRILRRQEGNANAYWYNYWSSPVGAVGTTSLTNNNGAGNNTNNSTFNIGMLQDGTGDAMEFTSAFNEVGKISNRWLYSFQNGQNYYGWIALTPASAIQPGVGYTQKGTGNTGTEQQYTFNGKPNNGTILVSADDVEGDSGNESEQDVTLTTTMVGNPYPSALDADEFIRDNIDFDNGGANPVIEGTILLWEQWEGNSHYLADYQGGYGYINLTETARAYQHPDIPIAGQTQTQGIKTPTKFIPVGQGFFVEVVNDGNIEFNNSQRVFKSETLGESVFFRAAEASESNAASNASTQRSDEDTAMQTIKLEFGVSNGATRRFVLGFSDNTTDGFDYGYDGGLITTTPEEDMTSLLGDQRFVIQAMSPITDDKVIDLNMHTSGDHTYSLDIVDIKNIDNDQAIYLRDHQEDVYWDLRQGAYSFTATAGSDSERFDIVFKENDQTLSSDEELLNDTVIFANSKTHRLYIKGLTETAKVLTLTNMLGQTVKVFQSPDNNTLENGLYIGELSSGVYLVNLTTETNSKLNKKIILE